MSKKTKKAKKSTAVDTPKKVRSGTAGDVAYLVRIVEEPTEPPIGLTQQDFDIILDLGASLPPREEVEGKKNAGKVFATLETVSGKKFYHYGEPIKKKTAVALFGRAMSKFINDFANKVRETLNEEDIPEEARIHDPLVEEVTKALLQAWFPNGHGGVTDEALAEDWLNWQKNAALDAAVAVAAVRAYAAKHVND